MAKLGLEIPPFILQRYVKFTIKEEEKSTNLFVDGTDKDGNPYSIFPSVTVEWGKSKMPAKSVTKKGAPYIFGHAGKLPPTIVVKLMFQGHYGEKDYELVLDTNFKTKQFYLGFNPKTKMWQDVFEIDAKGGRIDPAKKPEMEKAESEEKKEEEVPEEKK